jgi:hypothetical protein
MRVRPWTIALGLGWAMGWNNNASAAETLRYRSDHVVIVAVGGLTAEAFDAAPETAWLRDTVARQGARATLANAARDAGGLAALLPAGRRADEALMIVSQAWPQDGAESAPSPDSTNPNLQAAHDFRQALFEQRPKAALLALGTRGEREAADVDLLISYLWLRLQSEAPFKGKTVLVIVMLPPPHAGGAQGRGLLLLLGPDVRRGARPQRAVRRADIGRLTGAILSGVPLESEIGETLLELPVAAKPKPAAKPPAKPVKRRPRVRRSADVELSGYVASEATYASGRLRLNRTSDRASLTLRGTISNTITRVEGLSLSQRPTTVRRLLEARGEWRQPPSDDYRFLGVSASERKRESRGELIDRESYHFVVAGLGRPVSQGWKADLGLGWFETQNAGEEEGWGPMLGWQLEKKISANLSLSGSAVFIQPMSRPRRTRFQSDLTVIRPLGERLSLRLGLLLDNFTQPLRVSEDWSYQARVSLGYRYRK